MYTWMRIYMQPIVRLKWTKCFFFLSFLSLQDERSQHESVLPDSFPASRYRLWFVAQKRSAMLFLSFLFLPSKYLFVPGVSHTHTHTHSYHPDWLAGAHVIVVGIPALEFRVLSMLQNVLLTLEVWVVKADEGPALHTHRVHPVHEASVLEVIAVAANLQFPPGETFPLIEHDLFFCFPPKKHD